MQGDHVTRVDQSAGRTLPVQTATFLPTLPKVRSLLSAHCPLASTSVRGQMPPPLSEVRFPTALGDETSDNVC